MDIVIADRNEWIVKLADRSGYETHHGSIFDVKCDAIVSPGNSFGFMDGGLDYEISMKYGWRVQARVQDLILNQYMGELVVGEALVVPLARLDGPDLIYAPTMRVPMVLRKTINIYLAARAALYAAKECGYKRIVFPGMGTGVGGANAGTFIHQFNKAVNQFENPALPVSWEDAVTKHKGIHG